MTVHNKLHFGFVSVVAGGCLNWECLLMQPLCLVLKHT